MELSEGARCWGKLVYGCSIIPKFSTSLISLYINTIYAMSKSLFYRITQLRSTIGMPPITRKNIKALGLRRRNQTVYQKVSAATAHRLRIVKELVSIDLLEENQVEDAKKLDKPQWAKGFTQVGKL